MLIPLHHSTSLSTPTLDLVLSAYVTLFCAIVVRCHAERTELSAPAPSGPQSQPDESYRSALTLLKSRPNAKLIGYVATRYGARAASQVQADVLTYARWDAKWRVAGIFYDEAPNGSEEGQADLLNLYAGYVNYARRVMGRSVQVSERAG